MLRHPAFDPVAVAIGPVAIHWYGLMYLVGFAAAWWLMRRRARLRRDLAWRFDDIDDLLFWGAVGVIVGGRLGYVVFYNIAGWIEDPLMVFRVWEGGMAFHGGLIGVIVALTWFARRLAGPNISYRLGPEWILVMGLMDGVLFAVLWWFSARPRPRMAVSGMFLLLYGVLRFAVELVRMPDRYFGLLLGDWLTMGQLLCVPMVIVGALMVYWAYRRPATAEAG
ncbi:MAG: prolipoprotein diacylglyceryl transferase [Proteobacteria bacterium SW_6_67_9]|nr:MAG: prolipoprotein diacylglyceryl transferase [Proteobacteria bacterium SW_6_67_9]